MRGLTGRIDRNIVLIVAFSVFAWAPLLGPTYFLEAHDARHSIFFLTDFDQAIRDGAFYPRWGTDFALGYGYPLFILYSPLAFYVAEAFHLLGASLTASVKATYALAFIFSGLSMYAFAKRILGKGAGLLAALVYIYVPYHLVDIYVRSAFAEFCAFAFLPLVLLFFYELAESRKGRYLALFALAYAALILTHAPTAFAFTPFLGAYMLYRLLAQWKGDRPPYRWQRLLRLSSLTGVAILLALALSAVFLLPLFAEKGYMVQEQWTGGSYDYAKHFVYFSQLFSPFWGYGYAGEGLRDEMSLQLGAVATLMAMAGVIFGFVKPSKGRGHIFFFAVAALVLIAAMTPLAGPLWSALPLAALIQFPWRLLSIVAFILSFLAGTVLLDKENDGWHPALAVLLLVIILASYDYSTPQHTEVSPRTEEPVAVIDFETFHPPDRVGMTILTQKQPQDSPLVPQYLAGEPLVKAHPLTEGARVEMVRHGGASEEIKVTSPQEVEVEFYTYYFPGSRAYVDGQETPIYPTEPYGLIALRVPAGEHRVRLRFEDTPVRKAGALISLLALFFTIGVLAKGQKCVIMGFGRGNGSANGW
ncbi:MAG: 6-pyruvoyl-tetrahydropterin synthase-related protein [Anaerolineae bacterium]|nr:6-pyruvoyl-tetrahydropterin synthase-related protein [Anaerolineae bacterium]